MKLAEWPYVARENKNLEKNFPIAWAVWLARPKIYIFTNVLFYFLYIFD